MLLQSQNVHEAAYDSDWQANSNEAKQLIRLIITMAQRPVAVQAGLFGDLSLPNFSSVSRSRFKTDKL